MKNNFSISYAFLACNEVEELKNALAIVLLMKRPHDEIVIILDDSNYDRQILNYVYDYADIVEFRSLNKDFAGQKNALINLCSKDYILNLDADEYLSCKSIRILHKILELNPNVDLFYFPRFNTVKDITIKHVKRWGWKISKSDYFKDKII